ncbi:MAG: ATP-binding protein, partial [Candidatus Omnitrophota bacterium]
KKIEAEIKCPDEDITAKISRIYLNLIVANLVENAVKFNDSEVVKLTISINKKDGKTEVSVKDNGIGIPPEDREKIFEKFYQGEKHFTGNVEGAGLGLALVKRLADSHDGQISLVSRIKEGTTFTFTLPA